MNTLLYLALIQFILVVIIDDSGVIQDILRWFSSLLTKGKIVKDNYSLKPFTCSYCMTFWCGMIYLFVIGKLTIPYIAFVLFLSSMVTITKELINLLRDLIIRLINKIYDLIQ